MLKGKLSGPACFAYVCHFRPLTSRSRVTRIPSRAQGRHILGSSSSPKSGILWATTIAALLHGSARRTMWLVNGEFEPTDIAGEQRELIWQAQPK